MDETPGHHSNDSPDVPPMADPTGTPGTVTEATQLLEADGYTDNVYLLDDGTLRFSGTDHTCPIDEAVVERMFRFEGDSDPGDEMVVFGVYYPGRDVRGTLVSAYGPAADPEMLERLTYIASKVESG